MGFGRRSVLDYTQSEYNAVMLWERWGQLIKADPI